MVVESRTGGAYTTTHAHGEHLDGKTGKLIWYGENHSRWWLYFFGKWDIWRTNYCEQHRTAILPESFRRGKLNLSSIMATWTILNIEGFKYAPNGKAK